MSDGDLFSLGGEGSLSDFVLATVISRQRKSLSVFLSRRKKNGRKRKTAQGVPPLREFILSSLSRDENMNSRRLHPPRPPKERVRPVAAAPEMECTAENVPYSEQNPFAQLLARHDSNFGFPSRAAKQGRGIELVPGGNQDPRLTEPQRDRCRRSRRMRCSAPARLCRQMLHFASLTEIL